jgi:hypothetical protein
MISTFSGGTSYFAATATLASAIYVYRLVGTEDVAVRGKDPTGLSVLEGFFGPSVSYVLKSYDQVVASKAPFLDPTHFKAPSGDYVTEETLFLPLSDDGVNVNKILVFSQSRTTRQASKL